MFDKNNNSKHASISGDNINAIQNSNRSSIENNSSSNRWTKWGG